MGSPAEMVRHARRAAGLTQRALASRAETSAAAINRYERGRTLPDLETLRRVLAACGFELQLTITSLTAARSTADVAGPDQRERDREAVASALRADGQSGWVRSAAPRPSP